MEHPLDHGDATARHDAQPEMVMRLSLRTFRGDSFSVSVHHQLSDLASALIGSGLPTGRLPYFVRKVISGVKLTPRSRLRRPLAVPGKIEGNG